MIKDVSHNWKNVLININTTVMSAIKCMDAEAWRILLVVDEQQRLLGVITDGDIRRYLLKQASLEASVKEVMNTKPITASISENQDHLLMKMHSLHILHLPIVDEEHRVVGLETFDTIFAKQREITGWYSWRAAWVAIISFDSGLSQAVIKSGY